MEDALTGKTRDVLFLDETQSVARRDDKRELPANTHLLLSSTGDNEEQNKHGDRQYAEQEEGQGSRIPGRPGASYRTHRLIFHDSKTHTS